MRLGERVLLEWQELDGDWALKYRVVERCGTCRRWIEYAVDNEEFYLDMPDGGEWESCGGQAEADKKLRAYLRPSQLEALKVRFAEGVA